MRALRVALLILMLPGCTAFQVSSYYSSSTTGGVRPSSTDQSSGASSGSTGATSQLGESSGVGAVPSSVIVAGSAALLAVAGGLITTIYAGNPAAAKLRAEEYRKAHPPQLAPAPAPTPPPTPPPASDTIPPGPLTPPPLPGPSAQAVSLDEMVLARAWLRANELQLRQDLALGAGPALDDLAGLAGIAPHHRAHFGRVLQRNREALLIVSPTAEQAVAVLSRVGDLVMADPVLSQPAAN
ncbi:MAG: DUF3015 family protein [Archangium sp.]|nr:DUF3015 family protein [Archangium sp.]